MATSTTQPVTLAIIGCGERANHYAVYALSDPSECKVVTIAEPRPKTKALFAAKYNVDQGLVFNTWQDLYEASEESISSSGKRLADAIIVTVQDHIHSEVVLAFAPRGYHILCEKPMATSVDECIKMADAVKEAGVIFGIGHVLRYSSYNLALTEIVRSGKLGELVNIQHIEPAGYYLFAHAYVRGNWAKEKDSSFSLMTKSSHDIDILCHWLSPAVPTRVSSFGSLMNFRKSSKPTAAGNAIRCLDCNYERECAYSAKKIYLDPLKGIKKWPPSPIEEWPANTIVNGIPDIENITEALKLGPYGRCVYECDNDVCDNQVVNMEFSSGATVSFTMVPFTTLLCERQTRLHFSDGEIVGNMTSFTVNDFRARQSTTYTPASDGSLHGGDISLIKKFVEAVRTNNQEILNTDIVEVLNSHLTVYAAEQSRRDGSVINCAEFMTAARERLSAQSS